jgi:hypothetical protein
MHEYLISITITITGRSIRSQLISPDLSPCANLSSICAS